MASRRTTRVLAHGESFAVFETTGDILESPLEALGFFYRDTRHLSCFEIGIAGEVPHFLNSYVSDDNTEVRANLTNPDLLGADDAKLLPRDLIQIQRSWVLSSARLFQRIAIHNFAPSTVKIELNFALGADFRDMFEVRGLSRKKRGEMHAAEGREKFASSFATTDSIASDRATVVSFSRKPTEPYANRTRRSCCRSSAMPPWRWRSASKRVRTLPRANGKIVGAARVRRRARAPAARGRRGRRPASPASPPAIRSPTRLSNDRWEISRR